MKIILGGGYWIDASDGMNWTLYKGESKNPKKKAGKTVGYYATLGAALEAAVKKGMHADLSEVGLDDLAAKIESVADAIIGRVEVTFEDSDEMGRLKRFAPVAAG